MAERVRKSDEEWRQQLSPEQFRVCRMQGTEPAFTGEYYNCKEEGVYACVCCGTELFSSEAKFDSGTGWPSFWTPINPDSVRVQPDTSMGMTRIEVLCNACDAHLGHVFDDGPLPTNKRYCMNSVCLKLIKK